MVRKPHGFTVPKAMLVQKLQALMHTGQLIIAKDLKDAPAMMKELHDFRATYSSAGNPIFNVRSGSHDDLVLALAMVVFGATQPRIAVDLSAIGMAM